MARIDRPSLDALLELVGGDVDSLHELIQSYIDEAPILLENLNSGLSDPELLGRTAHTLKSSSKDFGALKLSELCFNLEKQAKSNSLADETEQVTQIQRELERCIQELSQIKSEQSSG